MPQFAGRGGKPMSREKHEHAMPDEELLTRLSDEYRRLFWRMTG